jgi:hypothetical protein
LHPDTGPDRIKQIQIQVWIGGLRENAPNPLVIKSHQAYASCHEQEETIEFHFLTLGGRTNCFSTTVTIPAPATEEFFDVNANISYARAANSNEKPNSYRVEWMRDQIPVHRYRECLDSVWVNGQQLTGDRETYYLDIPDCGEIEIEYRFKTKSRLTGNTTLFKTLRSLEENCNTVTLETLLIS